MATYKPFINLGPGDHLKDEMEEKGWNQKDLAEILDLSEKHVNQLLNNKVSITIEVAKALSSVFGQSPEFWLSLDTHYRLRLASSEKQDESGALARLFECMPVRDMQKKGWLHKDKNRLIKEAREFWGKAGGTSLADLETLKAQACFRRSKVFEKYNHFFALTWLQKVKNVADATPFTIPYSRTALEKFAEEIAEYTNRPCGIERFLEQLEAAGVRFLVIPHLEKTYTDGASLWHNKSPVIVLTCRFDRNDNFWFTLAHEIGHVLLHESKLRKHHPFIDSCEGKDVSGEAAEDEADRFARKHLKFDIVLRFFENRERISEKAVMECSRILDLHPAVIIGCLQHEERISYRLLNRHKLPVKPHLRPFMRGWEQLEAGD